MLPSRYLSHWYGFFLCIWFIGYSLGIQPIISLNPLYIAICHCFGFILLELYHILIKHQYIEPSFLLYKTSLHILPLLLLLYLGRTHIRTNAFLTLLVMTIPYLIYMGSTNKDIIDTYFGDNYPLTWDDIREICKHKNYMTCHLLQIV